MNFKGVLILMAGLCLCGRSLADTLPEAFIEASLGSVPAEQQIVLLGEVEQAARSAYGGRYPASMVSYWQLEGRRVWILRARGKFGYIHAGFVVEGGRLVDTEVLSSKEKRGRMISSDRFLQQLAGLGLRKNGTFDRRVDGYSGATVSVNAMKKMVRLALVLDSEAARD